MLQSGPELWRKEVEDYEARMFDYFSQCSARLLEWYEKGSEESDAYRAEYQRLSDEYQRYIRYIQNLREFVAKSENIPKDSTTNGNEIPRPSEGTHTNPVGTPVPLAVPVSSTVSASLPSNALNATTAAACYTQYYQEMIAYFDKLLKTIELAQQNGNSSSDEEEPNEGLDGKVIDEAPNEDEISDPEADPIAGGDLCCNPRAVMEQYFERYGEPGKWDWASWNNYLSWIARTNPQWYGIFLEYSQTLGIDWDEMYKCWRLSDAAKQGSETGSGPANSFHGAFPVEVPHVRLFANLPTYGDDDDDDDSNEWFCRTCNMQLETQRAFQLHLRGVTHIQKALGAVQQQHPQQFTGWTNYQLIPGQFTRPPPLPPPLYYQQQQQQQQREEELRHQAWLQSQYWQRNNAEFVVPGTFYCDLCKVNSGTHASLQAHLNGRRHRENVDIYYRTGESSMLKGKRGAHTKPTARLQTLLDTCTQPLVGLGYVVERQFGDEEDCVYLCELCDERITRQTAIKHVCDVAHRVNYMKLHYPGMCAIVVNDQSTRDIRLKRIELFARKIEDFEGRKRVKVKQLSAFDALRRIWRPLTDEEFEKPKWRRLHQRKAVAPARKMTAKKMKKPSPSSPPPKPDSKGSSAALNEGSETQTHLTTDNNAKAPSDNDDDLEEGEITEESSDENTACEMNSRSIPWSPTCNGPSSEMADGNEDWAMESNELEQADDNPDRKVDDLDSRNFLPDSVLTFEPDVECLNYIENLRSGGFLQLGNTKTPEAQTEEQKPKSEETAHDDQEDNKTTEHRVQTEEQPSTDALSIEEQFAREADWVLERTRIQREQEELYRRQLATAPKSTEPESVPYDQDAGYAGDQEDDETWLGNRYPVESNPNENAFIDPVDELLLPPLGTSFGPAPVPKPVFEKPQPQGDRSVPPPVSTTVVTTSIVAPLTPTTATTTTATMDPGRQRLAVSSGAVQIILSALNALRDAGQLPGYLNTVFDKTDNPASDTVSSAPNTTACTSIPTASVTAGIQVSQARMAENVTTTTTSAPATISTAKAVNTTQKMNSEPRVMNAPAPRVPRPNENNMPRTDVPPPFIPVPSGGPNSSLLGPPGPTVVHRPPISSAAHPIRPLMPRIPDNAPPPRPPRPLHVMPPPVPNPMDHPRGGLRNPTGSSVRLPSAPAFGLPNTVPPPPIRKDGVSELSSKVASYIRSDPNTTSETMFDAYALFSRRVDERNQSRMQQRAAPPPRFGRPNTRSATRKSSGNNTTAIQSGGRKLSAIADFLGVNEPPPVPKPPVITAESQASPTSTLTSLEPSSYLLPMSNLSSTPNSTIPRISLYIPHANLTQSVPNLIPTAPVIPSCMATPVAVPQPAIPTQVYAPAILPTISNKSNSSILGAPANLDEFLKKLRTT